MILYDSAFSPFSRKVRLVLSLKGLDVEYLDGLNHDCAEKLRDVNGRGEVPVLIDEGLVVLNSSDIVSYLDHQYPNFPVLPVCPKMRVNARKWERIADSVIDPIMVDISYWKWANRIDEMPFGMLEAAKKDLVLIYNQIERELSGSDYICGELSIADVALFPHLVGASTLGVPLSKSTHKNIISWIGRLKENEIFADDLRRAGDFLKNIATSNVERTKIFWRGERIEWVLSKGFEDWFFGEIKADRVLWPPQLPI